MLTRLKSLMGASLLVLLGAACFSPVNAAAFTVTSTDDSDDGACDAAHCSLREAINAANGSAGLDTISFNIAGDGPHTIAPTSELPTITDPVIIDGYTQPNASVNSNPPVQGSNAVLMIELNGSNAGASANGLNVSAGITTIRGLAINRFGGAGIIFEDPVGIGSQIAGNFIGTDITGQSALGNDVGIEMSCSATDNVIGGVDPDTRNVISGNTGHGISVTCSADRNTIIGNLIGTDSTGTAMLETVYPLPTLAESSSAAGPKAHATLFRRTSSTESILGTSPPITSSKATI